MPLKEYHQKRNLKKTGEPLVKKAKARRKDKPLMFVVQEHHASHLHYDFRLEWKGVLKSWAIPKGPSLDPKIKRLAVEVEDHPLSYGKFEGLIPEGEYGAGEVKIWDTGVWEPVGDIKVGFKKGHLEFRLKGKRLKGTWNLVKTARGTEKSPQWLLIKKMESSMAPEKKEPPPATKIPLFIEPELAELRKSPPKGVSWIHEIKFDGYRTQGRIQGQQITLKTRNGLDWSSKYPSVIKALRHLPVHNVILDGEIVCLDSKGRSSFHLLQETLSKKENGPILYFIFDILFLNGRDLRSLPLLERKEILKKLLSTVTSQVLRYSEHLQSPGEAFFKASCAYGLEGIMSKDSQSTYQSGRTSSWIKTKCKMSQEFIIAGYSESKVPGAPFAALLLGEFSNSKLKYVGKVGTGFSEIFAKGFQRKIKKLKTKHCPFHLQKPSEKGLHWLKPQLVAEVSFANFTSEGLLRSAVFKGLREDKRPAEVAAVRLTHPQKVLFKGEGITKKQVASFYQDFSELILPHLGGRPLVVRRCPDENLKKCFYQKHLKGRVPLGMSILKITRKGNPETSFTLDSKEGLNSLVQMRAYEIHCWNCHYPDIKKPDQIVMDLDPDPTVSWQQVIACALEFKKLLDKLKLKSFVKFTGGKGLHIHIPIEPRYTGDQIKKFSKALAQEIMSRFPHLCTLSMNKSRRKGKIFLDYFRNVFGATAVAPYSLRVGVNSSIAMPISWTELPKIPSPSWFSLGRSYEHLRDRKTDPWQDYFKTHQRIQILET